MEKWMKDELFLFLRENPVMTIAVNGDKYPISSVILFYIDDSLNIYFATGRESFKAKALLTDPHISFNTWKMGEALVQGMGQAVEINNQEEADVLMDKLAKHVAKLENFWPPLLHKFRNI